jgi:hypothetical protein
MYRCDTPLKLLKLKEGEHGLKPSRVKRTVSCIPFRSDDEAAALIRELHGIIEGDKYQFSPRIRTLRAILAKLSAEPVREPLPPPRVYAPPRATARMHRAGR